MEASPSRALAKRSFDSALMPPPPPPKRQKRPAKVLDEDVYSDALSHIIARDFFPGLLETEAQKEYMEALDSNNRDWIREAGRKLTHVMTPVPGGQRRAGRSTSLTPRTQRNPEETPRSYMGDTPSRTPINGDSAPEEKQEVDMNMSLGAFQSKYTSEDNESFNALLDRQNEKRAMKYAFFHSGNKILSARQIAHQTREQKLLQNRPSNSNALLTTNAAGEEHRFLTENRPSQDLTTRPSSVDSFRSRQGARNEFMFDPNGVEDSFVTAAQKAEENSKAPPKAVQYSATRFTATARPSEVSIPASPSINAIDAAIAGRPRATATESGYGGAETPRVNGYAFVDAEPTPSELGVPVANEEADAAEREAMRQFLPQADESGPSPFRISERSRREDLHLKLVGIVDASKRKGSRADQLRNLGITPGRTPTPRFASGANLRRSTGMTPAAQKLAERIGTPKRDGGVFGSGRSDHASWTPTPRAKKLV